MNFTKGDGDPGVSGLRDHEPLQLYSCFVSIPPRMNSSRGDFITISWYVTFGVGFLTKTQNGGEFGQKSIRSIKIHDKTIVICSTNWLQSPPVLREIERAIQQEDNEKRDVLFPVRIDDYIFTTWEHPRKADVVSKVVGDFRDPALYDRSVLKLVDALNKP